MNQNNKKDDVKNKEVHVKHVQKKSPEKNMSEIDEHLLKRFEIKKRLGKGAYGIVWKAIDRKSKEVVAIKKIFDAFRNQTDAQRTFREIIFLQSFKNHPNIVKLHSIHRALNNRDIYLGFEYMETDLHNVIKRGSILKDIHKRYIMYQMLKATKYIHSGNVIHRDQKPSNVLIDSACRVKLADFGLARSVSSLYSGGEDGSDACLTDYVATRWYRAPEILIASKSYTKGIDMWSLGCILGEMLAGKPLFPGSSTVNQVERIMAALPRPSREDIAAVCTGYGSSLIREQASHPSSGATLTAMMSCAPKDASDMVQRLLVFNPNKRWSAEVALSHEYVSKFHRDRDEPTLHSDVLLPLRDDKQLSVDDYRNKLYSLISKGPSTVQHRPTHSSKPNPTKPTKTLQEIDQRKLHQSVSADQRSRIRSKTQAPKPEPTKSEQVLKTNQKSDKANRTDWLDQSHCKGDYFNTNSIKKAMAQRRNSTSFSTVTLGDMDFRSQRPGVITASALMDLRTSIRKPNPTKPTKTLQEIDQRKLHQSVSADQRSRIRSKTQAPKPEPTKSEQVLKTNQKSDKANRTDWLDQSHCKGDYFNTNSIKKAMAQRRNSTSFSTVTLGDMDFRSQRPGVITASALMDLRTSIRKPNPTKPNKTLQEIDQRKLHQSVSADQRSRIRSKTQAPKPEPTKSEHVLKTNQKSDKANRTDWLDQSHCKGDYFNTNSIKKAMAQRRNSTSFSTVTLGDMDFRSQRPGVITASALMDLRTSIR